MSKFVEIDQSVTRRSSRAVSAVMIAPSQVTHGASMSCPTCGAEGRIDKDTPAGQPTAFPDAVWFNSHTNSWECYECWLK